jgi:hypothetical protein
VQLRQALADVGQAQAAACGGLAEAHAVVGHAHLQAAAFVHAGAHQHPRCAHLGFHAMLDGVLGQRDQHQRRAVRRQQFGRRLHLELQAWHAGGHQAQVGTHLFELLAQGGVGGAVDAQPRDAGAQVGHQAVDHLAGAQRVGGDGAAHAGQGVEQEVRLDLRGQHAQAQFGFTALGLGPGQGLFTGQRAQALAFAPPGPQAHAAGQQEGSQAAHGCVHGLHQGVVAGAGALRGCAGRGSQGRGGSRWGAVQAADVDADGQRHRRAPALGVELAQLGGHPLLHGFGSQPVKTHHQGHRGGHRSTQASELAPGRPALAAHRPGQPGAQQQGHGQFQQQLGQAGPGTVGRRNCPHADRQQHQQQAQPQAPAAQPATLPGSAVDRPAPVAAQPALAAAGQGFGQGLVQRLGRWCSNRVSVRHRAASLRPPRPAAAPVRRGPAWGRPLRPAADECPSRAEGGCGLR